MLSYTSNFNGLVGSLSRLNNNANSSNSALPPTQNKSDAPKFADSVNSTASGFKLPFEGFEQQLSQRHSMPQNQTMQLLQMFIMVLEELVGDVVTNSNGGNSKPDAGSNSQNGLPQPSQAEQKNTANRTEIIAPEQADKAPGSGGVWGGTSNSPTPSAPDAAEKIVDIPVIKTPSAANAWGSTSSSSATSGINSVASTHAPEATEAPSAPGGEAAQVHKSGGCPFMAMQSEQNSNSGHAQSANNPVMPSAGVAGSEGDQGSLFMGKSSNTTKPVENGNNTTNLDEADNRDIDFSTLSKAERSSMGLSDRERAVVHLWGRQMMSAGEQDGGIYTNVLGADGSGADWGNKDEVALIQELRAQEQERFGADTGWLLDEAYFDIMKDKTGVDMSGRYADRPVRNSKGPVNITNDIKTLEERTGISGFEQGVIRLMGHDALMDGEFDGSVLEFTVGNDNSLDSSRHSGGITNTIDGTAETLLAEDKSDDGQVNGSSILSQTISTLDRLYK